MTGDCPTNIRSMAIAYGTGAFVLRIEPRAASRPKASIPYRKERSMSRHHTEDALERARVALQDIKRQIEDEVRQARIEIERRYGAAKATANAAVIEAETARRAHLDETSSHPWDGRRVYRMVDKSTNWSREPKLERVDGVVEVVRTTSQFPANMNWGRPSLGTVIVRKVKADGTPSLQMHRTYGNIESQWTLDE